jgi:EmrB/QacA subfamily drug resistance transporter
MRFVMSTPTATPAQPQTHEHVHRWWILGIIATAQLMVVLDATIVNIALPSAQRALGFADSERQWIITAYSLTFGSLLLLGGRISDLFGRKWTFIGGLAGFAIASAIGGAAGSFGLLVTSRALQGVFGAILAPAALSSLANTFQNSPERGKAFGVFGAVAGGGGAVGLLLGGTLTEYANWRWCFYVNLFFAVFAGVGAYFLLRNDAHPERPKLDLPGTVTAAAGLFALVFASSHAETDGWSNAVTIGTLIAGGVLLAAFVLIERVVAHPLLPLRIVLDRNRAGAYTAVVLTGIAIFSVFLFLTYYFQLTRGFSPLKTGLAFLPMIAGILFSSILSNVRLLPILGARVLAPTGMVLGSGAMYYLTQITPTSSYAAHILPSLILAGLGFGMIIAPAISTATLGVARTDAGIASAMVNTMQQIGGSIGTAVLSAVVANTMTSYLHTHPAGELVNAAVHGYTVAFFVSGTIFLVGALVVFSLVEPIRTIRQRDEQLQAQALPEGSHA